MPTLIYTPEVKAYIYADSIKPNGQTIDVSDDLTRGTLVRRSDGVSTFDFSLMNARRKYDQIFTPNDRITVLMKRVTWVQVFTGYLNSVPLRTAWPQDVQLSASCSLKRLQYFFWNPYAMDSYMLLTRVMTALTPTTGGTDGTDQTSGSQHGTGVSGNLLVAVLTQVVKWPKVGIHLGEIPAGWKALAQGIYADLQQWVDGQSNYIQQQFADLGGNAIVAGTVASRINAAVNASNANGGASVGTPGATGTVTPANAANWSAPEIAQAARNAGFTGDALVFAVAIHLAEDGSGNPKATNTAGNSAGTDRGAWQINSFYHPEVTDAQAFDPNQAAVAVYRISKQGTDWHEWSTANSTAQIPADSPAGKQINAAKAAVAALTTSGTPTQPPANSTNSTTPATDGGILSTITNSLNNALGGQVFQPPSTGAQKTGTDFVQAIWGLLQSHGAVPYDDSGIGQTSQYKSDNPVGLDCSSLVMWGLNKIGVAQIGMTAADQYHSVTQISVELALRTPGALLFHGDLGHVVISVGDGTIFEEPSHHSNPPGLRHIGGGADPKGYAFAGLIPGLSYPQGAGAPALTGNALQGSIKSGGTNNWPVANPHTLLVPYRDISSISHVSPLDGEYNASGQHLGVDFAANWGDNVMAVDTGTVLEVGNAAPESSTYGTYVKIQSGNTVHIYGHLSSTTVVQGQQVTGQTVIGAVGNSGPVVPTPTNSQDHNKGTHLHFEVRGAPYTPQTTVVDPIQFITKGIVANSVTAGSSEIVQYSQSPGFESSDPIDAMFGSQPWVPTTDNAALANSNMYTGVYTMINDQPVLQYVQQLCSSTMRSYCSAPNGDFIAWFPDYYGLWGTAGILKIKPIELIDLNIIWTDDNFVTHLFVQPAEPGGLTIDPQTGLVSNTYADLAAWALNPNVLSGVATIDSPAIMAALFGFPPDKAQSFAQYIYQKFGARPYLKQVQTLRTDASGTFFMALYYFLLNWAYQYQASIPITFMPEAWPGMLIQVEEFNLQAYITSVTHTFQFGPGGSFNTQINICAPAILNPKDKKLGNMLGMPLAGGYLRDSGIESALIAQFQPQPPASYPPAVDNPVLAGQVTTAIRNVTTGLIGG